MHVQFYFDPSCPYSWIASRWLLSVQAERDIKISWVPFSLALKNLQLTAKDDEDRHAERHRQSHRLLRLMQAASERNVPVMDLYSAFGYAFHVEKRPFDDALIEAVLQDTGVDAALIKSADEQHYDVILQDHIDTAVTATGRDIGVPTTVFALDDGTNTGYFGPVLFSLPDHEEALDIWDGLSKLATTGSFYELKRRRPAGGPDVMSTK